VFMQAWLNLFLHDKKTFEESVAEVKEVEGR
jgi:hypothetical protein